MSRELDSILNVAPTVQNTKQALTTVQNNFDVVFTGEGDERFNEDFEEIRDQLKSLIAEISDNASKLAMIAQDTEKAAHFSALSQMMTVALNANKQLLEIYSERKRYFKPTDSKKSDSINVQNAIFTGTTADLRKWIKENSESS